MLVYTRLGKVLLPILLLAGMLFVYLHPPGAHTLYPICLFQYWTHLDCPGCGSTRALYALLHGHVNEAADENVLFLLLLPVLLLAGATLYLPTLRVYWQRINQPRWFLFIILLFWLLRNLPIPAGLYLHSGLFECQLTTIKKYF